MTPLELPDPRVFRQVAVAYMDRRRKGGDDAAGREAIKRTLKAGDIGVVDLTVDELASLVTAAAVTADQTSRELLSGVTTAFRDQWRQTQDLGQAYIACDRVYQELSPGTPRVKRLGHIVAIVADAVERSPMWIWSLESDSASTR